MSTLYTSCCPGPTTIVRVLLFLLLAALIILLCVTLMSRSDDERFVAAAAATYAFEPFTLSQAAYQQLVDDASRPDTATQVMSRMTLSAAQDYCTSHDHTAFVGYDWQGNDTYKSVYFLETSEDAMQQAYDTYERDHTADATNTAATADVHLDLYIRKPADYVAPHGPFTTTDLNRAIMTYWNDDSIRPEIHRPMHIRCPPAFSSSSSSASTATCLPGQQECFLSTKDVAIAKLLCQSTKPTLLRYSTGSKHLSTYHTDDTLFYVTKERDVYIRQNQMRCATVQTAMDMAREDGVTRPRKMYSESNPEDVPCSYEYNKHTPGLSITKPGCVVGQQAGIQTFRTDLQTIVSKTKQCEYPSLVTIPPTDVAASGQPDSNNMFPQAYQHTCSLTPEQVMDKCATTYNKDDLTLPYYHYVFPYAQIQLVRDATQLQARIQGTPGSATSAAYLVLDTTAQYHQTAVGTPGTRYYGQVLHIDAVTDPTTIQLTYSQSEEEAVAPEPESEEEEGLGQSHGPTSQHGSNGTTKTAELVSIIMFDGDGATGHLAYVKLRPLASSTSSSPASPGATPQPLETYQLAITKNGYAFTRIASSSSSPHPAPSPAPSPASTTGSS